MVFTVTNASDSYDDKPRKMVFNSLSELETFQRESKYSLIINFERLTIIVYDDYIE